MANNIDKLELTKKLFKAIYGELISLDYKDLSDNEIVEIAYKTITQYANRQGVKL